MRLIASFSAMAVKRKVVGLLTNFDFQWPTEAKLWCVWLFLAPKMAKKYKGGVNHTIFYHLITPHCDECNACCCGGVQPPFVAFCIFNAFKCSSPNEWRGRGGQSWVQPPSFSGQNFDHPFLFTHLDLSGHTWAMRSHRCPL